MEHYIGQVLNYVARQENDRTKDNSGFKEQINDKEKNLEMGKTETMNMKDHKKELVDKLVRLEWQNFDQVKNEGGRADCQDDWGTFSIMRTSQYLTWREEMLQSYIQDFEEAMAKGWNLITEKYGRMMESTAPDRFDEIKEQFPYLAEEKKAIIDEIELSGSFKKKKLFVFVIKYLAPVCIVLILISSILEATGIFKI